MIKLPIFILLWAAFFCLKAVTYAIGLVVVPFIYQYRFSPYRDLPWWTRPWSNPEDHLGGHKSYMESLPEWWVKKKGLGFRSWW